MMEVRCEGCKQSFDADLVEATALPPVIVWSRPECNWMHTIRMPPSDEREAA